MMKTTSSIVVVLLVLCLFLPSAARCADEEIWWESAREEADKEGYKLINTRELAEILDSDSTAIIVDVRADYEFMAGHIPDAENMEFDLGDRMGLSDEKRAAFTELIGGDKQRRVIIYCRSFR